MQWDWVLLEMKRKRPNALTASQRDNIEARSRREQAQRDKKKEQK